MDYSGLLSITTHVSPGWVENVIFWSVYFKTVLVEFSRPIRMKTACFSRTSVYKNFKNHFCPDPTRVPGPQTKYCPGKDLNHFRHGNLTYERGIKCRNKSTESTTSAFMSDMMAKTMVAGFKRLPQRPYLGGHTSRFGSRTHFQLATFSGLMRTPEICQPRTKVGQPRTSHACSLSHSCSLSYSCSNKDQSRSTKDQNMPTKDQIGQTRTK